MATGEVVSDINVVGLLATRVMARSVVEAVKSAESMFVFTAYKDLKV